MFTRDGFEMTSEVMDALYILSDVTVSLFDVSPAVLRIGRDILGMVG